MELKIIEVSLGQISAMEICLVVKRRASFMKSSSIHAGIVSTAAYK